MEIRRWGCCGTAVFTNVSGCCGRTERSPWYGAEIESLHEFEALPLKGPAQPGCNKNSVSLGPSPYPPVYAACDITTRHLDDTQRAFVERHSVRSAPPDAHRLDSGRDMGRGLAQPGFGRAAPPGNVGRHGRPGPALASVRVVPRHCPGAPDKRFWANGRIEGEAIQSG